MPTRMSAQLQLSALARRSAPHINPSITSRHGHGMGGLQCRRARRAERAEFGSSSYIQRPFVKTRCLQSHPKESRQASETDPKTFPTDNAVPLEKAICGTCFVIHPALCHRGDGGTRMAVDRGDAKQTNEQAKNCLRWNFSSLFFI